MTKNEQAGHDIMSQDIIPALICSPTRGRTISLANHAHPPEGIMSSVFYRYREGRV